MTDWYRTDHYYQRTPWRGRWDLDGGGVLLNQCPHNLDMLQWLCGMPRRVRAFCYNGKYHPIEVEDEATLFLEWEGGATGVFVTSTCEAPGVNRLEITLENGLIICEAGSVRIARLDRPEREVRPAPGLNTQTPPGRPCPGTAAPTRMRRRCAILPKPCAAATRTCRWPPGPKAAKACF